jgi:hypothetical protein
MALVKETPCFLAFSESLDSSHSKPNDSMILRYHINRDLATTAAYLLSIILMPTTEISYAHLRQLTCSYLAFLV